MVRECQDMVSSCLPCQRYNVSKHGYHPPKNVTALLPFDHLFVDLKEMPLSAKGNKYILVLIDCATRFGFFRAIADKSKYTIAQTLLRIFCDVGFPKILQTDNGTEFINDVLGALKHLSKIDSRTIAPYNHRAQGIVERANQTIAQMIHKEIQGLTSLWDDFLPKTQYSYNTRVLGLHGSSPYSLLFARQANDFIDYRQKDLEPESSKDREQRLLFLNRIVFPTVLEKVKGTNVKRNEQFMKSHKMLTKEFPGGSYVMIRDELRKAKSEAKYEGPFLVVRRQASGNYLLKAVDGTEYVRHPSVLKLVSPDIVKGLEISDNIYAAVDKIVDHREDQGITRYRVRWKGQSANHDSWLRHKDFYDYGPLNTYLRQSDKKGMMKGKKLEKPDSVIPRTLAKTPVVIPDQSDRVDKQKDLLPVNLSLDDNQLDAVGRYWAQMKPRHRKKAMIVDSNEDSDRGSGV